MQDSTARSGRMFSCCAMIAAVIIVGTVGFIVIEGWDTQDSFYMTVITLSTVGFGETRELSPLGRFFTAGLIFVSIVTVSIWTACLTSLLVEGDLTGHFRRKQVYRMLAKISDHTILCGSGKMAVAVLDQLCRKRLPVVVIDCNKENLAIISRKYPKVPVIEARAVDEMALADAQLLKAKSVVAAMESDYDNLLIAMTCKDIGSDVKVIARSDDERVASRMMRVGVDEVVCPLKLTGLHMASLVTA